MLQSIFEEKLGVTVASVERIHRLGRLTEGKPRPVILRLYDFNEKLDILRNASKLKGSQVFISEDFSRRVQLVRKELWNSIKHTRKPEDKVSLRYDKLIVNSEVYTWDESTRQLMKLSSSVPTQRNES